jgi:signal transduction histidine kinase
MTRRVGLDRRDEIGTLAAAFDAMAESLAAKDAELRGYADHLEQRVGEQTSELRTLYAREQELRREAEEANRVKDEFLSTVSHELRTPLNTIILLSHLIEREGKTPADEERRLHDIRVIRESAEALLRMINNILDLAKLEAGERDLHPQRVPLKPLLDEIVDMLEPQARAKDLPLVTEIAPDLPESAVLDRE